MDDKWHIYRHHENGEQRLEDWSTVGFPQWRKRGKLSPNVVLPDGTAMNFQPVDPTDPKVSEHFHYRADPEVIDTVNLALRLRRPLLITGVPGTGKTSLAESITYELGLGPVLEWLITSRSTVRDGLYQYDALGRVSDMTLADKAGEDADELRESARDIGRYITLGPLGDALLPRPKPRVLLIDEIDKCDMDLPGDLLHVLDRGSYEIPELVREGEKRKDIKVQRAGADTDEQASVWIHQGRVECYEFPIVVITSNEERDFSPAFRRRCLPIRLKAPDVDALKEIAAKKLRNALDDEAIALIEEFVNDPVKGRGSDAQRRATSQLLNVLYVRIEEGNLSPEKFKTLCEILLAPLDE